MLPEIGWMIGAYIKITRIMEILNPKEDRNMIGSVVVGFFACAMTTAGCGRRW